MLLLLSGEKRFAVEFVVALQHLRPQFFSFGFGWEEVGFGFLIK
jgi:hypothetical protein